MWCKHPLGAMLYLNMNIIVHPIFWVSVVCIFCTAFGIPEEGLSWKSGIKNQKTLASQQCFKFKDKFPMDSSKILRFSFSRCIVYKDGNLKLSKKFLFCKWDVILLLKKPKQTFKKWNYLKLSILHTQCQTFLLVVFTSPAS